MSTRPRLTPAIADARRAVRETLAQLALGSARGDADAAEVAEAGEVAAMRPLVGNAPAAPGALPTNGRITDVGRDSVGPDDGDRADVLVALSGGADSLALAAATAFEAPRAGLRAGAVIVDHGLQAGSADVAARAAQQARELGLDPVIVRRVEVGTEGGPEAAARDARYTALAEAAAESGARAVLLGHTLDDQAETLLLGLARGSGAGSLSGMAAVSPAHTRGDEAHTCGDWAHASGDHAHAYGDDAHTCGNHAHAYGDEAHTSADQAHASPDRAPVEVLSGTAVTRPGGDKTLVYARPLLGIRRSATLQFCADSGLTPWHDPQNLDDAFARVRVREKVLPVLEREIGPGIAEALARTAELAREDAEALDFFAQEQAEELADHAEAGLSLSVKGLANNPAALRQRIIRFAVSAEFGVSLSRTHTLEVARLVTDWRGQGELHLPGVRVVRQGGLIVFSAAAGGAQTQR